MQFPCAEKLELVKFERTSKNLVIVTVAKITALRSFSFLITNFTLKCIECLYGGIFSAQEV